MAKIPGNVFADSVKTKDGKVTGLDRARERLLDVNRVYLNDFRRIINRAGKKKTGFASIDAEGPGRNQTPGADAKITEWAMVLGVLNGRKMDIVEVVHYVVGDRDKSATYKELLHGKSIRVKDAEELADKVHEKLASWKRDFDHLVGVGWPLAEDVDRFMNFTGKSLDDDLEKLDVQTFLQCMIKTTVGGALEVTYPKLFPGLVWEAYKFHNGGNDAKYVLDILMYLVNWLYDEDGVNIPVGQRPASLGLLDCAPPQPLSTNIATGSLFAAISSGAPSHASAPTPAEHTPPSSTTTLPPAQTSLPAVESVLAPAPVAARNPAPLYGNGPGSNLIPIPGHDMFAEEHLIAQIKGNTAGLSSKIKKRLRDPQYRLLAQSPAASAPLSASTPAPSPAPSPEPAPAPTPSTTSTGVPVSAPVRASIQTASDAVAGSVSTPGSALSSATFPQSQAQDQTEQSEKKANTFHAQRVRDLASATAQLSALAPGSVIDPADAQSLLLKGGVSRYAQKRAQLWETHQSRPPTATSASASPPTLSTAVSASSATSPATTGAPTTPVPFPTISATIHATSSQNAAPQAPPKRKRTENEDDGEGQDAGTLDGGQAMGKKMKKEMAPAETHTKRLEKIKGMTDAEKMKMRKDRFK